MAFPPPPATAFRGRGTPAARAFQPRSPWRHDTPAPFQCVSRLALLLLLAAGPLLGAGSSVAAAYLPGLPVTASISGMALDGSGNLLVSGSVQPGRDITVRDAFAAKFSPDGQTLLYYLVLADLLSSAAVPMAVDSAGNLYVAGNTTSPDFSTTPGALQTSFNGASLPGFVVKLDPTGKTVYSTLFYAESGESTYPWAMAVNAAGEVFLTGETVGGNFPTTPGSLQPAYPVDTFFVLRLGAAGDRLIYSVGGVGESSIAVDAQNNAYILGASFYADGSDVPITPGAYQSTITPTICSAAGLFFGFAFPCQHQYAAKLDPTGTKLLFCTFVSGTYSETPAQILVDANGDVYLAGTTGSTDYPTTSGALQPIDNVTPPPPSFPSQEFYAYSAPQLQTGYLSKLSGDGARLIYSTFLGGSQMDSITGMAMDPAGELYLAARVQSPDFPGLPALLQPCLPSRLHDMPLVARLDPNAASVTGAWLVEGVDPGATGPVLALSAQTGPALDPQGGLDLLTAGPHLARIPASGAPPADALACIVDAFDYAPSGTISPGQILTIFGNSIGPASPLSYDPKLPTLPTVLGGASLLVGGVPAPLMYVSAGQIDFIVPYEIQRQTNTTLQLAAPGGVSAARTLAVSPMMPSLATGGATDYPVCQGQTPPGSVTAVVLNADGTPNSCANPATAGLTVSVFLNGTGINVPGATGANPSGPVALQPAVVDLAGNLVLRAVSVPWAPLGSWEVDVLLLSPIYGGYQNLRLTVGGAAVRETTVAVWDSP